METEINKTNTSYTFSVDNIGNLNVTWNNSSYDDKINEKLDLQKLFDTIEQYTMDNNLKYETCKISSSKPCYIKSNEEIFYKNKFPCTFEFDERILFEREIKINSANTKFNLTSITEGFVFQDRYMYKKYGLDESLETNTNSVIDITRGLDTLDLENKNFRINIKLLNEEIKLTNFGKTLCIDFRLDEENKMSKIDFSELNSELYLELIITCTNYKKLKKNYDDIVSLMNNINQNNNIFMNAITIYCDSFDIDQTDRTTTFLKNDEFLKKLQDFIKKRIH